jgi:hypothetical protein
MERHPAVASEDVLAGALRTAWKLRVEKNAKAGRKSSALGKGMPARKTRGRKW